MRGLGQRIRLARNQISNNRRARTAGVAEGKSQSGFDAAAADEATPTTGAETPYSAAGPDSASPAFPAAALSVWMPARISAPTGVAHSPALLGMF